jgi:recombination protein RecT
VAEQSRQMTPPDPTQRTRISECGTIKDAMRSREFRSLVTEALPSVVTPQRMLSTFERAIGRNPQLAECSMRSLLGAFLTVAQLGLEPNTPLGHIHLIPFRTKVWNPSTNKRDREVTDVNVILGYGGMLELSYRSGLVRSIHADVVWKKDVDEGRFLYQYGTDTKLIHRPLFLSQRAGEEPVYAYAHAMLQDGQAFVVLPWSQVLRTRDRSQAYQHALRAKENAQEKGWRIPSAYNEAPWVRDIEAMAAKTAFRALWKWMPKAADRSGTFAAAMALEDVQDRGRVDFGAVLDAAQTVTVTDQDGQQREVRDFVGAAAGAAMGDDDGEEPPAQRSRNPQRPQQATQRGEQAQPHEDVAESAHAHATVAPPDTDFGHYLLDHTGEVMDDEFSDPVHFAKAYAAAWGELFPPDRDMLFENNRDAIIAACVGSEEARGILEPLRSDGAVEPQQKGLSKPVVIFPVPEGRGRKPDWKAYADGMKQMLAMAVDLPAWFALQIPTVESAPTAIRIAVARSALSEFKTREIPSPPSIAALISPTSTEEA